MDWSMTPDVTTLAAMVVIFAIAGTVKGIVGLGLPAISVALLTAVFDLTTAMALMLVPSFVINLWQALTGGHGLRLVARLWPMLLMVIGTIWLGAAALTRVNLDYLSALLGALLIIYAVVNLAGFRMNIAARHEKWLGPLFGAVNGVLTGMTGAFTVPGVMYLQAIGLSRDVLIQAMGILFTTSTVTLAVALQGNGLLTVELGAISVAALLPVAIGVYAGQRLRRLLTEEHFRQVFFTALLVLGTYLVGLAVFG
jgi:uncharacterized membrane protein YfcA